MPLPADLQSAADAVLTDLVNQLEIVQSDYITTNGRYWQGLVTHTSLPQDGQETVPNPNVHPTDQADTWNNVGIVLTSPAPIAVEVLAYDGPQGPGYVIIGSLVYDGERWIRSIGVGPELRSHSWLSTGPVL